MNYEYRVEENDTVVYLYQNNALSDFYYINDIKVYANNREKKLGRFTWNRDRWESTYKYIIKHRPELLL